MTFDSRSRLLSLPAGRRARRGVGAAPTPAAVGSPRDRGTGVTVSPAWRLPGVLVAGAALVLAAACEPRVQGNGVYLEDPRNVGPFVGVRIDGPVGVVVTVEPGLAQTVKVIGDENLVRDHIKTEVGPDAIGTTAVSVLRVWVDVAHFQATIPPKLIVTRPSFALVRAEDGAAVELRRPAGSSAAGGRLAVDLDGASVLAKEYPVDAAEVGLVHRSTATLRSAGPVTGSVSGDSRLDNSWGEGSCGDVVAAPGAEVACPL